MQLGADGKLPELSLTDGEQKERKAEEKKGTNPWILAGVLVGSVGLSVLVLFMPTGGSTTATNTSQKDEARRQIEEHYINKPRPGETQRVQDAKLKPYQQKLRAALEAHHRGDLEREKTLYLEVIDMLHSEGLGETDTLTGKSGRNKEFEESPPNDTHLQEQLTILLN